MYSGLQFLWLPVKCGIFSALFIILPSGICQVLLASLWAGSINWHTGTTGFSPGSLVPVGCSAVKWLVWSVMRPLSLCLFISSTRKLEAEIRLEDLMDIFNIWLNNNRAVSGRCCSIFLFIYWFRGQGWGEANQNLLFPSGHLKVLIDNTVLQDGLRQSMPLYYLSVSVSLRFVSCHAARRRQIWSLTELKLLVADSVALENRLCLTLTRMNRDGSDGVSLKALV